MTAHCVVCGWPGTPTKKALSGLPKGLIVCDSCLAAVERREVGVVIRVDGSLHVTDSRPEKTA